MKQNHNSLTPHYLANQRYSFTFDNLLGKGATGNVYRGYDHKQNKHVAIKVIETGKMNQVQKSLIQNEKQSLKILKHDNIMKLHHIEEQQDFTFIISQIYEGGCLKSYLEKKGRFGEQEAMEFFRKIIQGYCAVVEANIIHRDLKPTNILLTVSNEPVIIDFGYSQIIIANKNLTVFNVGSPSYMSPEAYNKTIYSQKSDVWSLGAIFYELLMNTTLDNKIPTKQYFQSLMNSEFPPINFDLFGEVSKQILKGTLAVKPEQRITSHRIKYLLDKEIIGKKLCNKVMNQPNSCNNSETKPNHNNAKSLKKFEFMVKEIDFSKFQAEEEMKNMKRKPMTMKAFSNFTVPINSNDQTSIKMISLSSAEVIQEIIKNESGKKSTQRIQHQFSSFQRLQTGSANNTPSISRIDFNPMQTKKNSMSTINYVERRFDGMNTNTASNLIIGSREASKITSTMQISSSNIRSTLTNPKYVNEPHDFRASSAANNEYFNGSTRDTKNLTYNEGFYYPPQNNNISLTSSVERTPILSQTDKQVSFSSQVRAGATRYAGFERQPQNQSHLINDLSNTFETKKSTKRLSFASTIKEKAQINDDKPLQNYESAKYQQTAYNQNLQTKRNQNSQFKLSFKTMIPVDHVDMREGQLKNFNQPKRLQNNFESQNVLNFREKPQSYQAPKSYQDLGPKSYQTNQPTLHQKTHYPPKPVSSNQIQYGYQRMTMQNQGWNHQPQLQFQHGTCHLRNSSESDPRNMVNLRKII